MFNLKDPKNKVSQRCQVSSIYSQESTYLVSVCGAAVCSFYGFPHVK